MTPKPGRARAHVPLAIAAAVVVVLVIGVPFLLTPFVAGRLRAQANARGFDVRWQELAVELPLHVRVRGLEVERRETHSVFVRASRMDASVGLSWRLHPRV